MRRTFVRVCIAGSLGWVVLALFVTTCVVGGQNPIPLVISTDNAAGILVEPDYPAGAPFDDFLAIMQALNEPGLEVRGLVPMFGNHRSQTALFVTEFLLDVKKPEGRDRIFVGEGSDFPIGLTFLQDPTSSSSDPEFGPLPKDFCLSPGVRKLKEHLESQRATLLAIGPLTDVACLLVNWPDLARQIDGVIFLGGRYDKEATLAFGSQPLPDFNYNCDTTAASIVLESGVPFTSVPGTLAQQVHADFRKIKDHGTKLSVWIAAAASSREQGIRDIVPWDSVALNRLVSPDMYVCAASGYKVVDCKKEKCAGHDMDDRLHFLTAEVQQLWLGPDLPHEDDHVSVCYAFAPGGAQAVVNRIEERSF